MTALAAQYPRVITEANRWTKMKSERTFVFILSRLSVHEMHALPCLQNKTERMMCTKDFSRLDRKSPHARTWRNTPVTLMTQQSLPDGTAWEPDSWGIGLGAKNKSSLLYTTLKILLDAFHLKTNHKYHTQQNSCTSSVYFLQLSCSFSPLPW